MSTPPRWDLTNVYPSLDSKEYEAAVENLIHRILSYPRRSSRTVDR